MPKYSMVEEPSCALWNSVLSNSVDGNFEQTFEYGEIMKSSNVHTRVVRLLAVDSQIPVGIVQGVRSKILGFGTRMTVGGGQGSGPVTIFKGEERAFLVKALLVALESLGMRDRTMEVNVWCPESWGIRNVFRDLTYKCTRRFNIYKVDLDKSVDELWSTIDPNKRKNVREAIKKGVTVVEGDSYEKLLSFYRMLEASGKRAGFVHPPLSEFGATWKLYKPTRIFLARWKGKDVAGVFVVVHGNTVYARAAGSLEEAWSARPNDLLHWKVMEWASGQHISRYHMGLVTEPVPTKGSRTWGLWRWKREWNGSLEIVQVFHKTLYLPQVARAMALLKSGYETLTPRQQRIVTGLLRYVR